MKATFIETTGFTDSLSDFMNDRDFADLQRDLMANPDCGDVMPGCGGMRKVRTTDSKRGKGKRGGARVIYLHVPDAKRFYLLDIYGKNEKDDLSAEAKKLLRKAAEEFKRQAIAALGRRLKENGS